MEVNASLLNAVGENILLSLVSLFIGPEKPPQNFKYMRFVYKQMSCFNCLAYIENRRVHFLLSLHSDF